MIFGPPLSLSGNARVTEVVVKILSSSIVSAGVTTEARGHFFEYEGH